MVSPRIPAFWGFLGPQDPLWLFRVAQDHLEPPKVSWGFPGPKPPKPSQTSLGHPRAQEAFQGHFTPPRVSKRLIEHPRTSQDFPECFRAFWYALRFALQSGVPSNRWFRAVGCSMHPKIIYLVGARVSRFTGPIDSILAFWSFLGWIQASWASWVGFWLHGISRAGA